MSLEKDYDLGEILQSLEIRKLNLELKNNKRKKKIPLYSLYSFV